MPPQGVVTKQEAHEGLCSTGMDLEGIIVTLTYKDCIVLTSYIIVILTISRAIIQSCMGGSGWFKWEPSSH